jgi:hypothetical protein
MQDDICALACELARYSLPDACAGAGDEGPLAGQPPMIVHSKSPLLVRLSLNYFDSPCMMGYPLADEVLVTSERP